MSSSPRLGVARHSIQRKMAHPAAAVASDKACIVAVLSMSSKSQPPRSAPHMPTHTANAVLRNFGTSRPAMNPPIIPMIVQTIQSEPAIIVMYFKGLTCNGYAQALQYSNIVSHNSSNAINTETPIHNQVVTRCCFSRFIIP